MGMFDYVRCKYPLLVEGANALVYQSKDTPEQYMDTYEIRENGQLWHIPFTDGEPEFCPLTGEVRFYTSLDTKPITIHGEGNGWIEFSAYFEDGIVVRMNLIANDPPMTIAK